MALRALLVPPQRAPGVRVPDRERTTTTVLDEAIDNHLVSGERANRINLLAWGWRA
jgi:hypothetical protein